LRERAPWWRRALLAAGVSGALSVVAALVPFVHLPGGGLGESPVLADAVAEHRRYTDAESPSLGITVADVGGLEQWVGSQLGLTVKLPAGAVRGAVPVGARVVAVAGRPAAQILYAGDGRHISLFVARKPSRPLPGEGEHIINGREVYTTTLGANNVGWWEDRRHLYLVVSSAQPEDLLALAELCKLESAQPASEAARSDANAAAEGRRSGSRALGPAASTRESK
jgi:anti-sigma factor RsiW